MRYPKIPRIQIDDWTKRGKHYISECDLSGLLDGEVCIEEKLDGKLVELPRQDVEEYVTFYEDLKRRHTVQYTALPAWLVGIDIWDGSAFLNREDKEYVFATLDVPVAPLLWYGEFDDTDQFYQYIKGLLGSPSAFGADRIEGVVIKNHEKQVMAKVVDPVFDKKIDVLGHHLRRPYVRNRLKVG